MSRLRNIAMREDQKHVTAMRNYQKSVTIGLTDGLTDTRRTK